MISETSMLFDQQLLERSQVGICALIALTVLITLITAAWQWHQDWQLAHATPKVTATAPTDRTAVLLAALPSDHLFGQDLTKVGEMPISNLQLHVTGIVKTNTEEGVYVSKAYISIAGGPSKIYQIGDSLPYGVKVYGITADAVILENDGRLEQLPLPRQELIFKPLNTEVND